MKERRYEYLYGQELQKLINEQALAWVPLGILEKHGEHLPWGLDGLKAHGICMHLANRLGGVVLPATHLAGVHEPWDPDPQKYQQMQAEVGNFYLQEQTLRMLLKDTIAGLANIGFKVIVLYTGHYPELQRDIMQQEATKATDKGVAHVIGFDEYGLFEDGDHAGKWETSLYMALDGEARMEKIDPSQMNIIGYWYENNPPTEATKAFGLEAIEKIEQHFTALICELLN